MWSRLDVCAVFVRLAQIGEPLLALVKRDAAMSNEILAERMRQR